MKLRISPCAVARRELQVALHGAGTQRRGPGRAARERLRSVSSSQADGRRRTCRSAARGPSRAAGRTPRWPAPCSGAGRSPAGLRSASPARNARARGWPGPGPGAAARGAGRRRSEDRRASRRTPAAGPAASAGCRPGPVRDSGSKRSSSCAPRLVAREQRHLRSARRPPGSLSIGIQLRACSPTATTRRPSRCAGRSNAGPRCASGRSAARPRAARGSSLLRMAVLPAATDSASASRPSRSAPVPVRHQPEEGGGQQHGADEGDQAQRDVGARVEQLHPKPRSGLPPGVWSGISVFIVFLVVSSSPGPAPAAGPAAATRAARRGSSP